MNPFENISEYDSFEKMKQAFPESKCIATYTDDEEMQLELVRIYSLLPKLILQLQQFGVEFKVEGPLASIQGNIDIHLNCAHEEAVLDNVLQIGHTSLNLNFDYEIYIDIYTLDDGCCNFH